MAKKYPAKHAPVTKTSTVKPAPVADNTRFRFTARNVIPVAFCMAYLGVHGITNFDAYDAMGPQWLYVVIIDILGILYILAKGNEYDLAATAVFRNIFSKLYIAFFVLAGLSAFVAINPTETWVCYARLIATIIAFFNISILLYQRTEIYRWLAHIMSLLLLVESYFTVKEFLDGLGQIPLKELILNLKGTAGNKNIFAAGLLVKIPFVLYCIQTSKLGLRILNIFILLFASYTLFLVNARAAYLALLLIAILYILYCFLENRKEKNTERLLQRIGFMMVPLVAAFFISQVELGSATSLDANTAAAPQDTTRTVRDVGTVAERLGGITNIQDESNKVRLRLWGNAIDYAKHHPVMGAGFGNWKIASIPYQRLITEDLFVPVHAHNDFFEAFAELGIPGGLLYLSLFICIIVFTYRTYYSDASPETKLISIFSFLSFTGYSVDAFFNFPSERPVSQVFFALLTAVNVMAYLDARRRQAAASAPVFKTSFTLISILLLMPAVYITYQTYKSLVVQRSIIPDLNKEPMQLKWQELFPQIPSIPNLSASAQPFDAIKGRYMSEAGRYDEALALLDKGRKANPVIGYSEFLKAGVYFKQSQLPGVNRKEKLDSARRNAMAAFDLRPKAKTYYQTLLAVLAEMKDTTAVDSIFRIFDRYRHFPFGWDMYFRAMLGARNQRSSPQLVKMADSAAKAFPGDSLMLKYRLIMIQGLNNPGVTDSAQIKALAKAQEYYNKGVAAFTKAKAAPGPPNRELYLDAAQNFIKASELQPNNYIIFENAGISYFNINEFDKSIRWFNKSIALNTSIDGKSEYFKGVALYNTGKRDEGCKTIGVAANKGYAEAITVYKANCNK